MVTSNRRLLMNGVTRNELFQLTMESWRKPLPLTVSGNSLPPAVAPLGEIEVTDGAGGHVPLDRTVPIAIASTAKTWSLAVAAISMHLRQMLTGSEVQRVVTDMADKLGSTKAANIVMLGAPAGGD
jgi:hypothetical protein